MNPLGLLLILLLVLRVQGTRETGNTRQKTARRKTSGFGHPETAGQTDRGVLLAHDWPSPSASCQAVEAVAVVFVLADPCSRSLKRNRAGGTGVAGDSLLRQGRDVQSGTPTQDPKTCAQILGIRQATQKWMWQW